MEIDTNNKLSQRGRQRTIILVLFLDGAHAARGPARHAASLREVLCKLAQLIHVVGTQLRQDAGQQLMELCTQQTLSFRTLYKLHSCPSADY